MLPSYFPEGPWLRGGQRLAFASEVAATALPLLTGCNLLWGLLSPPELQMSGDGSIQELSIKLHLILLYEHPISLQRVPVSQDQKPRHADNIRTQLHHPCCAIAQEESAELIHHKILYMDCLDVLSHKLLSHWYDSAQVNPATLSNLRTEEYNLKHTCQM